MRNPLAFMFADRSQHGGRGDTMGRPSRNADEADREGWRNSDRTGGFVRRAPRRKGRRN